MFSIAIILISLGCLLSFANWWSVYWSYRTKRFHSAVPFFGAAFLAAGMLMIPATRIYAWSALILDYGTLAFLLASPQLVREIWNTSRFNLLYEYLGQAGMKTVHLRLFRRDIFTIRLELHRPPGEPGLVGTGTIGTWKRDGKQLALSAGKETAAFDVIQNSTTETLRQSEGFLSWEKSNELSLASIDFIQTQKRVT
jgi:hypothetical protein